MARTKRTDRKSATSSSYQRATFGWKCAWSGCGRRRRFRYRPELLRHMNMNHQKASNQDRGLQSRRPSEANVSREVTAGSLLEFVDLNRDSTAGTPRSSSSATWSAPAETGDRPLTLADRARMRTPSTPHRRSSSEYGEEHRSPSIDQSSRSAKNRSTSRRAENYSSTATAGSVVSASVSVTAKVAGSQPAERAVLSPSQGTEKGPESTVRAVAVTATADNDSARVPQPVSRSAPPPQRTSDRGRNVPTQVKAPSTRSMGTQTKILPLPIATYLRSIAKTIIRDPGPIAI